jgi:putative flavoprotein involved in K+ transport
MTVAIDEATRRAPSAALADWLNDFGRALETEAIDTAVSMFAVDSYWRDLVSFSWNIIALEGQTGIENLLRSTLARTRPSHFALEGEATGTDGLVEG